MPIAKHITQQKLKHAAQAYAKMILQNQQEAWDQEHQIGNTPWYSSTSPNCTGHFQLQHLLLHYMAVSYQVKSACAQAYVQVWNDPTERLDWSECPALTALSFSKPRMHINNQSKRIRQVLRMSQKRTAAVIL